MKHFTERPCAAEGLTSYRYRGRYGWIMIGARDVGDALREAARSTSDKIDPNNLQVWTIGGYAPVCVTADSPTAAAKFRK